MVCHPTRPQLLSKNPGQCRACCERTDDRLNWGVDPRHSRCLQLLNMPGDVYSTAPLKATFSRTSHAAVHFPAGMGAQQHTRTSFECVLSTCADLERFLACCANKHSSYCRPSTASTHCIKSHKCADVRVYQPCASIGVVKLLETPVLALCGAMRNSSEPCMLAIESSNSMGQEQTLQGTVKYMQHD